MANNHGYIGRAPGDSSVTVARQNFQPGAAQTDFTFASGYTVGYLDAYLNGVKLIEGQDYEANDGSVVGLNTHAIDGDILELVAYKAFNIGDVNNATGNFSVGNNLTVVGISSLTDVVSSGIVTADYFYGDGSNLTNVVAAGGTASVPGISTQLHSVFGTLNVSGIATFASTSNFADAVTVSDTTSATSSSTGALIINGGVGIAKSLFVGEGISVGGTITYDDVTNIDSVGFVTAGLGLRATAGGIIVTAGVGTFKADVDLHGNQGVSSVTWDSSANSLIFKDSSYAKFGTGGDLEIYHDGSNSHISDQGSGVVYLRTNNLQVNNAANNEAMISATENGLVDLYYDNSRKFMTTPTGVEAVGVLSCSVGADLNGYKVEEGEYDASTSLNGEFDFELENGNVQYYNAATGGDYFPDVKVSGSQSLTSVMDVGDVCTITLIVKGGSHKASDSFKIDNSTSNLDLDWVGGTAPSNTGSGYDMFSYTIVKTAATPAWHVMGNALNAV